MSEHSNIQGPHVASIKTYIAGFSLALLFTFAAYALVQWDIARGYTLIGLLLTLAICQTIIQLWFFLHVGREDKPQWNAIFLLNTVGIIILIVVASILVMNSLNYRMMTPEQMEKYVIEESSKGY